MLKDQLVIFSNQLQDMQSSAVEHAKESYVLQNEIRFEEINKQSMMRSSVEMGSRVDILTRENADTTKKLR